jgi:hypothetical protein
MSRDAAIGRRDFLRLAGGVSALSALGVRS